MPKNGKLSNDKTNYDNEIFRSFRDIVDHTHNQISYVRTAYKWLISLVAILIIVGFYFTYKSAYDFRNEIKQDGKDIQTELRSQISSLETKLTNSMNDKVSSLNRSVESKIDEEFKKENIEELIIQQSQLRVDEIAKPYISKTIKNQIDPQIEDTQKEIVKLKNDIELNIKRLEEINELTITILSAQNDDRPSFDKLYKWANNNKYEFRQLAEDTWLQVMDTHSQPFYNTGFHYDWPKNLDPSKLTLVQLIDIYKRSNKIEQVPILEYINKRSDIPKSEKMSFFIEVLKTNKSLRVVEYAGRYFTDLAGIKIKPLAIDYLIKWWDENQSTIN